MYNKLEKCPLLELLWIGALLLILLCSHCRGGELPPLDPGKPVYQTNMLVPEWAVRIHPGMTEVDPLTAEELKDHWNEQFDRNNRRKMWNRGFWFLSIGIPLAIGGMLLSGTLAMYGGQMLAHLITPLGITLAGSGALLMELAEWWILISIGLGLLAMYALFSYLLRDKGITKDHVQFLFRKRPSRDAEHDTGKAE